MEKARYLVLDEQQHLDVGWQKGRHFYQRQHLKKYRHNQWIPQDT
jgi:hypothetical protein